MLTYLSRHLQVLFATIGDMCRTPMSSINTMMIVAITLLLPAMLYVLVNSGQALSGNWQGRPQISIFLDGSLSKQEAKLIFDEIRLQPSVELAEFITPAQALEEFKLLTGQGEHETSISAELAFLGENPLPPSIVVMPNPEFAQSEKLLDMQAQLSKIEGIDTIRLDLDWTDRFNALLKVFSRGAALLSILLGLALVLIVSNTIKLLIVNRRQEIEIAKLVGGTDTFVRRPFLYYGALFGFFGGLICLALLLLAATLISPSLSELASLYENSSLIYRLNVYDTLSILLLGTVLGWLAARWSVAQHLRKIQPN